MQILLLLVIGGLMHAAGSFAPVPGLGSGPAAITLACGFLLLTALMAGNLFKEMKLPRLTGYLVAGIVVGPQLLGLVTESMVVNLRIFNGVAIALIALTAGTEMEFRTIRPLFRSIAWITLITTVVTVGLLAAAVYLLSGMLPFTADMSSIEVGVVALVLAVTMAAKSPAVVVALRKELEADGPVARTVLGVVVLSDLITILLFALVSALGRSMVGEPGSENVMIGATLLWEMLGSLIGGVLIGILIATFLRNVREGGALFVVTTGFIVAEVGQRINLDPLLLALAAGIFIRNFTTAGDRLHHEIEEASLPVYVAFFAVAGATIHLDALFIVGVPAAIFVLVRAAGLLAGTRIATGIARSPEPVRRYAGFGLLPQAGLALALALLFARTFPQFGAEASALVFGVVAINELVAPVLYRIALVRSGEAGRKHAPETESEVVAGQDAPLPLA